MGKKPRLDVKEYIPSKEEIEKYFLEIQGMQEDRLKKGAIEYGEDAWKDRDNIAEFIEELIDALNYAGFIEAQGVLPSRGFDRFVEDELRGLLMMMMHFKNKLKK